MQKLIIKKNEIEITHAERTPLHYDGQNRESIFFYIDPALKSLDELDALFRNPDNLKEFKVSIKDNDGTTHDQTFHDFAILVKLSKETIGADPANGKIGQAVVIVHLAKKTYAELQNEKIIAALAKLGVEV